MNDQSVSLNDVHSALNPTIVKRLVAPRSAEELPACLADASREGLKIIASGGRHAMGGQQFVSDGVVLDLRGLNKIKHFDSKKGLLRVEAGIQWPELISEYLKLQEGEPEQWGITQKQTGADTITLGGSLAVNAHGRGLTFAPIIQDVEEFTLLKADGQSAVCSRIQNAELFSLAIGGYGLFGVIIDVTLRLSRRQKLERVVEIATADTLEEKFKQRIAAGFLYDDFQFAINESSTDFLRKGVFSCYRPTDLPVADTLPRELEEQSWLQLLYLAYTDRQAVYEKYSAYYLSTSGQVYWSDTHQLSPYLPDYAARLRNMGGNGAPSSLMITELYVPLKDLNSFLNEAATTLQRLGATVIYGTVRLIEEDTESFLPWAKQSYACIIFNLLVDHSPTGKEKAAVAFRALIDLALAHDGNYFLTYHRFATREQMERGYPAFGRFMEAKSKYDPHALFESDWYLHYSGLWQ
ncbi:MAG: FAD-binding oxidoreductase [Chthoniobacterales bacterium]